ncbi:hypothetical protein MLD38_022249 [Melastoma candidum]|uniref:Uncharacterized protein n=1 Tax=Melastoma candidum TaxID=119954 RepID=A0ACB9QHU3_9MYRT|nr:hypothetical protein MLD38_022249 [Melastoma candidum]
MNLFDKVSVVDKDAFIAPSASVICDVQIGRASSIWYGCVLRGHGAVLLLHGCTVEDEAFIGALVRQNTRIPAGEVWRGNPAKFLRKLADEEIAFIARKFACSDEEYDSMLGVVPVTPPDLILPNNILPDKAAKASEK